MSRLIPKRPAEGDSELAARLRAIINTVVDGIITIDGNGTIESVNPATERIFQYKAREMIGNNIKMLMPPQWAEEHDNYIQRYLKTGKAQIIGIGREAAGVRKDGTIFPMYLAISEVRLGKRRLFTGIIRDISARKIAEQALAQASENERRILGQELHDGLGQQLTGASMLAKALQNRLEREKNPAQKDAAEVAEMLARTLSALRRQAHGLYPVELERSGLFTAIEELSLSLRELYGVNARFLRRGKLPPMDKTTALHLYRIVQEATSNAIRHGQAKQICISLNCSASVLTLSVEDNGRGINLKQLTPGMGIIVMRYRASVVGAKLDVRRAGKRGTIVQLVWTRPTPSRKRNEKNNE